MQYLKNKYYYLCIILFMGFTSCGNSGVISQSDMVDVLCDIHLTQSVYSIKSADFGTDAEKNALLAGVLEKHGITEAQLDSSLVWYSDNTDKLIQINDSVKSKLKQQLDVVEKTAKGSEAISGISGLPQYALLDETKTTFTFSINRNDLPKDGSAPVLNFKATGLSPTTIAKTAIFYEYQDTTITITQDLKENKLYSLSSFKNYDGILNKVSGYIHVNKNTLMSPVYIYDIESVKKEGWP